MISFPTLANSLFLAFGIPSGPDLIILLIIVLVLFGAKRLPEIARSLGQSVNEFKKAKQEFDDAIAKPTTKTEEPTVKPPTATIADATVQNHSPTEEESTSNNQTAK